MMQTNELKKTLGPVMLWGLGVGYVISGMYFGWNLGLAEGGTLGLGIATLFIITMYVCFTFCYTEMACAIPKAGGAFDYADRALGKKWGFIAGMAQNIEFVFAPPAIAFAIAAYLNLFIPGDHTILIAIVTYLIFTGVNIVGVRFAATFELLITIIAVGELLLFTGLTLPHVELSNLAVNALPNGISGIFAAIPFAIWFFLAIEGVANVAEETVNPQRNIKLGFGAALATLVTLCILVFISSVGVNGWESAVYAAGSTEAQDTPLVLILSTVLGENSPFVHLVAGVGIFGLVASFHGILLAGGRATFEFGRVGYFPKAMSYIHPKLKTPVVALLANTAVGIIALFTGKTGDIITLACFGAIVLYAISMVSFIKLRKEEPELARPYRVKHGILASKVALVIAVVALVSITIFNLTIAAIFFGIMGVSFIIFNLSDSNRVAEPDQTLVSKTA
ncbi:ethanolamine permease [Psychromonas antarctica]|jgi:ethanolamine permease|uniref:ethanolamine permease n=1 Tax=Psychromonas antarctica TaxID=67573 RepID=UPI001EE7D681|nr:ethanolamine permease [Psychromonas antarctica]MCG6201126.1 ethanolamine permease [Psychromonas antarctica]